MSLSVNNTLLSIIEVISGKDAGLYHDGALVLEDPGTEVQSAAKQWDGDLCSRGTNNDFDIFIPVTFWIRLISLITSNSLMFVLLGDLPIS